MEECFLKADPAGLTRLRRPILPLANMVEFLWLAGDFADFTELINQLPTPIETSSVCYPDPAAALALYVDLLEPLRAFKRGEYPSAQVLDSQGQMLDVFESTLALVNQSLLVRELEGINSQLCSPCGCRLCCVGPAPAMRQQYFEIPLQAEEIVLFSMLEILDTPASRAGCATDEPPLQHEGQDFFACGHPLLARWQQGWSLILPTASACPHLEELGRCRIYDERPQVCRRPQIFAYLLEQVESTEPAEQQPAIFCLRQSLLAVVDCPYVRRFQEEIAAYAATCELELVLRENKV